MSGTDDLLPREDRLHKAMLRLTSEVILLQGMVVPMSRSQQIFIVATSSFLGGVLTNIALWSMGHGLTMFGVHL